MWQATLTIASSFVQCLAVLGYLPMEQNEQLFSKIIKSLPSQLFLSTGFSL